MANVPVTTAALLAQNNTNSRATFADLAKGVGGGYGVLAYGATGNGSTDDTAAIQAALDAALAAGGGTVVIPSGTYKTTGLTIGSNTTLLLAPDAEVLGTTDTQQSLISNTHWNDSTHTDTDITVLGGIWSGVATARVHDGCGYAWLFQNVSRLHLGNASIQAMGFWSILVANANFGHIHDIHFDTLADGLHFTGTTSNFVIRNLSGRGDDDFLAFVSSDWVNTSLYGGPITNILVEGLFPVMQRGNIIKVEGSPTCPISFITIRDVHGTIDAAMGGGIIQLETSANNQLGSGTVVDNLLFEDMCVLLSSTGKACGMTLDAYKASNITIKNCNGNISIPGGSATMSGASWNQLLISDVAEENLLSATHYITIGPTHLQKLIVEDVHLWEANENAFIHNANSHQAMTFEVRNVSVDGGTNSGFSLIVQTTDTGAFNNNLLLSNFYAHNCEPSSIHGNLAIVYNGLNMDQNYAFSDGITGGTITIMGKGYTGRALQQQPATSLRINGDIQYDYTKINAAVQGDTIVSDIGDGRQAIAVWNGSAWKRPALTTGSG